MGFHPADYLILAITALLVPLILAWRRAIQTTALQLAGSTAWCMGALALLPVTLRLILLPHFPVPTPAVSDDFSYLLVADTLRHFRLANPPHPMHRFFETFFVLQEPTYSSIFPPGQGIVLAIGGVLFGHPWAGVLLSIGALSALCYWMLRGWTTPGWALVGGLLTAIEFGPLNQWTNSYWGGAVSAVAGCLVFGSLPRLRERVTVQLACVLGIGLSIQLLTRPFEFIFLFVTVVLYTGRPGYRRIGILGAFLVPALALTAFHNKSVTGSWTTLPYQLSRYQYGVPATFTIQPNPVPHHDLTPEQKLDYEAQVEVHGPGTDTLASYFARLAGRLRYYRFFFLAPLYLALPFFLPALVEKRFVWVAPTLLLFALGTDFYPYFYPHYIAVVTCLFVLVSVKGLETLSRLSPMAAQIILTACIAQFLFWYGLHVLANQPFSAPVREYETWDAINHGDPDGRIAINHRLAQSPGKQLVFVRYWPRHTFSEWVHNAAGIDASRVVWARDLGPEENEKLRRYYPDRNAWLLEPDARPPRLGPYPVP